MKIKFAFLFCGGGGGHWGQRGKSSKNPVFGGKRHDNKISKGQMPLSRIFVVIAQGRRLLEALQAWPH